MRQNAIPQSMMYTEAITATIHITRDTMDVPYGSKLTYQKSESSANENFQKSFFEFQQCREMDITQLKNYQIIALPN